MQKKSDLHRLSREELERSRFFLDSLIEHLPNMIFVKDAQDFRFVHFNRAGETLLGLQRESLLGKNDHDLFPKDQADFFMAKDRAVIEGGVLVDIPEEPISTRTGLRYLHTRKIPLFDEHGKPAFLLGISEDITSRKEAEAKLAQSQEALRSSHTELEKRVRERTAQLAQAVQARDEFLSIASHELKTPLTPLKLQIQNLLRIPFAEISSEQLERFFKSSDRQIRRLTHLVDDLLDVSRITNEKLDLNKVQTDLSQLVRETIDALADPLNGTRGKIQVDAPEPVTLPLDRVRIEQVLGNLLTNAAKYAPGSPIQITVRAIQARARLSIEDAGPGIPAASLQRIFARFERVNAIASVAGLGLGLYISRQIVEAHGGTIRAENIPSSGARFTIELPLDQT